MQRIVEAIGRIQKRVSLCKGVNLFRDDEEIPSLPPIEAYYRGKREGLQEACDILQTYVRKE